MCVYVCASFILVCGTELPLLIKNLTINSLAALRASLSCLQNTSREREKESDTGKRMQMIFASTSKCEYVCVCANH